MDWERLPFGAHPYYDLFIAMKHQLTMSSTVKPLWIFVGELAETFFSVPGHGTFRPENHGVWDPAGPRAEIWGTGDEKWQMTTEEDTAEFTAEVVTDLTKAEGSYRFCGSVHGTNEIAKIYEEVKGKSVQLEHKGSLEDLREIAEKTKKETGLGRYWEWIGYYYQLRQLDGTGDMQTLDNDMYPEVKRTSLAQFLKANKDI